MKKLERLLRLSPPMILFFALFGVYLATIAPGLTWANDGSDGGDLITAAATGGIAHPTGYPLFILLARLFQFLPIGSLAFRTNLMSALAAAIAALIVYKIVAKSLSSIPIPMKALAGLSAGFAFGLAPLIWSQAVITEVYTLHVMFMGLLLFLSVFVSTDQNKHKRLDLLVGAIFGLAMGNHITTIFILPVILLTTIRVKPNQGSKIIWKQYIHLNGRALFQRLIGIGLGLLVYIILPLRANTHPPVNWGNPSSLGGFIWLVTGKLYQGLILDLNIPFIMQRAQTAIALLLEQFGIIGLCIGFIGLILFFKPNSLNISMLWIVFISFTFAIGYGTSDAYLYLIPAFLCFAVWIGVGLGSLMVSLSRHSNYIGYLLGLIITVIFLIQGWSAWSHVDASHDQRAETFGKSVLSIAPTDAIVFAKGDEAVFSLWYFQYALQERTDLAIISTDLLQYGWYLYTLQNTYPKLNLPGSYLFKESVITANPRRSVCYVQYEKVAEINCLPAGQPQIP